MPPVCKCPQFQVRLHMCRYLSLKWGCSLIPQVLVNACLCKHSLQMSSVSAKVGAFANAPVYSEPGGVQEYLQSQVRLKGIPKCSPHLWCLQSFLRFETGWCLWMPKSEIRMGTFKNFTQSQIILGDVSICHSYIRFERGDIFEHLPSYKSYWMVFMKAWFSNQIWWHLQIAPAWLDTGVFVKINQPNWH